VRLVDLELDLDVFAGPFDLLLTLILKEEIDLLEVDLADVVISYIDHLERPPNDSRAAQSGEPGTADEVRGTADEVRGTADEVRGRQARSEREELDLEAATEFLVLIAALLELKSRLMLPGEEIEELDLDPGEAAEELLQRLLDAHRFRSAADSLQDLLAGQTGCRFRSAPLPRSLRRAPLEEATAVYDPRILGASIGELLQVPDPVDIAHISAAKVTVAERLAVLRALLRRGRRFSFDEAVAEADRVTVAVTLFALLELYKQGELTWEQDEPFGEISIEGTPVVPVRADPEPVRLRVAS
jgi:segregation and condensation protein A